MAHENKASANNIENRGLADVGVPKSSGSPILPANKVEIEDFFNHVVLDYNVGDIDALLKCRLTQAGPLLAVTVNGIDTLSGMIFGFEEKGCVRFPKFMIKHMDPPPSEAQANMLYVLVRCGFVHEGVTKPGIIFFAGYDEIHKGSFLYNDDGNSNVIHLNVAEFARSYVKAVRKIAQNITPECSFVPQVTNAAELVQAALIDTTMNIGMYHTGLDVQRLPPPGSGSGSGSRLGSRSGSGSGSGTHSGLDVQRLPPQSSSSGFRR